ncbi:FHA domain-containing protein [Cellulomonas sp. P24]|uniref:FHA domain-containing protein FhaB/FipA n=1 Tax=Cellulomonas sp. P24 TaxID=2885206 RepID=UPI00216B0BF8|nr:FHA domain-containing protein [Cellulomonas sp. P24]
MNALTITLLRLGYLILLWAFVLSAVRVLRHDLYGTRISTRRSAARAAGPASVPPASAGSPGPSARREAPPRREPSATRLVVVEGSLRGTSVPLGTSSVLIGRAPSCTLVIDDIALSSRHARLFPEVGGWVIEDLGSTNGTFVAGRRIDQPTPVPLGAQVRVGTNVLELQR